MIAHATNTYYNDKLLYVPSQGNMQKLTNGNQFIGWGQQPYLSESSYKGNTVDDPSLNFLYDMQFPNENISYRAFKNEWIGLPLYPPTVVAKEDSNSVIVFASWNGSTETTAWQVLTGPSPNCLLVVNNSTPSTGFETAIKVDTPSKYIQVNALNACGQVIGTSRIITI
ncbi:hypothetical protein CSC2_13520 [Clostridium zeae]|uniref:Uncharacterized protein n=1 Tax=Clostridium zeae TaxID=2759022 RepID=A0ABQ1E7R5_9CLOT|nr:hypothetical protein [Clostridium zeae]GFZ30826.1 hypothetical protein CSC2_13520 [Clostridium zeae]